MSTAIPELGALSIDELPLVRFSVEQYHRMIENGVLAEDDRVELIEGYLVEKMTKNPPHRVALGLLDDLLRVRTPTGWHVANQDPITLDNSEPEPDLSIVRGQKVDYRTRHPAASEIALVVEVADTSLDKDLAMAHVYARNGIPVYWIVNINNETVEVYRKPEGTGILATYAVHQPYGVDQDVPLVIEGNACLSVPVNDILSEL